jgi:hypothetical protein
VLKFQYLPQNYFGKILDKLTGRAYNNDIDYYYQFSKELL